MKEIKQNKRETRKDYLFRVALEYLKKIDVSMYGDALRVTIKYDEACCDGLCLIKDMSLEMDIDETVKSETAFLKNIKQKAGKNERN